MAPCSLKGRSGGRDRESTIRDEIATLQAVMAYAASKRCITDSRNFKGKSHTQNFVSYAVKGRQGSWTNTDITVNGI
jgi:hypothetical protein